MWSADVADIGERGGLMMQSDATLTPALLLGSLGWVCLARRPQDGLWPFVIAVGLVLLWAGTGYLVSTLLGRWIVSRPPTMGLAGLVNGAVILTGWLLSLAVALVLCRQVSVAWRAVAIFAILWASAAFVDPLQSGAIDLATLLLITAAIVILAAGLAVPFRRQTTKRVR